MMTVELSIRQKVDDAGKEASFSRAIPSLIEAHLPVIFQQLPAGVIILDQHGTVIGYNPAASDLLGEPLFAQSWWQVIQRAFVQAGDQNGDLKLEDGRVVNLQTCPMGNQPGQIILCHEVTQVRALEGRLKRYQRLSESGELAARLAHQIRTPLSAALLYCDQLVEVSLANEKRLEFSQKMKARLLNIESHIKDMLLLFNVPSRHEFTPISVGEFVATLRSQIDHQSTHIHHHVDKSIVCELHLSSLIGAINNCIQNAFAAQATQVDITLIPTHHALQIRIQDNGKGMPESVCAQACQPFYTTKKQGTGLGLAVVRSVAHAHGGDVNIYSQKNHGTTVEIMIPILEMQ